MLIPTTVHHRSR